MSPLASAALTARRASIRCSTSPCRRSDGSCGLATRHSRPRTTMYLPSGVRGFFGTTSPFDLFERRSDFSWNEVFPAAVASADAASRVPYSRLRRSVKFHQGCGEPPARKSVTDMNTSRTHGSWRAPVATHSDRYNVIGSAPISSAGAEKPNSSRSRAPAGPMLGRSVKRSSLFRETLIGFTKLTPGQPDAHSRSTEADLGLGVSGLPRAI